MCVLFFHGYSIITKSFADSVIGLTGSGKTSVSAKVLETQLSS